MLELSEENFYLHVQAGVTLFDDLLQRAFGGHLADNLPSRVLPISTNIPQDINVFLDTEFQQIRELLKPVKRHRAEAHARLTPLIIMEANLQDIPEQPTTPELDLVARRLATGEEWRAVFPGVAALRLDMAGQGQTFSVRFTRDPNAGPVRIVRLGEEGDEVTLIREVDSLDRYSMGLRDLAVKLGLTPPKTTALMLELKIQSDSECYREIRVGKTIHRRYSPKALEHSKEALSNINIDEVWARYRQKQRSESATTALGS
ncbi:MAG: hypothetical protein EXR50_05130 [Dehalococcoidia bacterium]|nr:hypothetical protein [Dehalococcoidia bacterium]